MTNKRVVIFDLDDTLYKEIDFLKSAFIEISKLLSSELNIGWEVVYNQMIELYGKGENTFECTIQIFNSSFNAEFLLNTYRNHQPKIVLSNNVIQTLDWLLSKKIHLGLLTDGRSKQQRNKIIALGLKKWFTEIVISEEFGSEKPNINNYKYFEKVFGKGIYYYVGDNIKKDFISANTLNWTTICLENNGLNIHDNRGLDVSSEYLAHHLIPDLTIIKSYIHI